MYQCAHAAQVGQAIHHFLVLILGVRSKFQSSVSCHCVKTKTNVNKQGNKSRERGKTRAKNALFFRQVERREAFLEERKGKALTNYSGYSTAITSRKAITTETWFQNPKTRYNETRFTLYFS